MNMDGKLVIISGFSGSGKGTVVSKLIENDDKYCLSISATTREKRDYEEEGVHYFFKTKDEFEDMIKDNELLEYANYAGNYYGTPKSYVFDKLKEGKNVILEIEQQGGFQVKKMYEKAILIFIITDSFDTLLKRLENRKSETKDTLVKRFSMALTESDNAKRYDYIIVNDTVDNTVEKIKYIVDNNIKDENEFNNNIKIIKNIKENIGRYLNV